ncbi:hypothetical protein IWZ03DRAFT_138558 [Phyllosticta citriasiana]|uniref:Secreted protein n=1 Tax=Phyllosticta citriasiana TaxID=595635 RepID=A0ABR1KUH2_9PEZI
MWFHVGAMCGCDFLVLCTAGLSGGGGGGVRWDFSFLCRFLCVGNCVERYMGCSLNHWMDGPVCPEFPTLLDTEKRTLWSRQPARWHNTCSSRLSLSLSLSLSHDQRSR